MEVEVLVAQSCLTLVRPLTVAHQAPLSMEFSRQEYCSGRPFPSPGDLPHPGIKLGSPALQVDSLPSEPCYGVPYFPQFSDVGTTTTNRLKRSKLMLRETRLYAQATHQVSDRN